MDRRSVLAGLAVLGTAPLALAQSGTMTTAAGDAMPMPTMDFADVKKAPQFFMNVLPRAELSLATSQIAVGKARQPNALEFAGFELGEAVAVNMVLKDMGLKSPEMDQSALDLVEKHTDLDRGAEFDRTYIALQLANHEYLRDMADAYLQHTVATQDPEERHGRHLASLMFAVFGEHVAICKRISGELSA